MTIARRASRRRALALRWLLACAVVFGLAAARPSMASQPHRPAVAETTRRWTPPDLSPQRHGDPECIPDPDLDNQRFLDGSLLRPDAVIGSFGQQLGVTGLETVDVDGNGVDEIVVGHPSAWYVLRWVPARDDYVQVHWHEAGIALPLDGGNIVELAVGELDGDPGVEIAVLFTDKTLAVHDATTGELEHELVLDLPRDPAGLHVANIDATPLDELLVFDDDDLLVYQAGSASFEWRVLDARGTDLTTGNFDDDPALEIAIGRDADGWMIDTELRDIEWIEPLGFGTHVDSGDVDDDGRDEIVGVERFGDFFVVDADTRTRKFSIDNVDTSAILAHDVDGDTLPEVLLGDGQLGEVQVRDAIDGSTLGSLPNPEHSVANITIGDVDGDCTNELVWGAGFGDAGSDRLHVADLATETFEWENIENDGPMHCFGVGDVDADGRQEVLRVSSRSDAGSDGALVFVTDLHRRQDEQLPSAALTDGQMPTQGLVLAQLDDDRPLEYVVNGSTGTTGRVRAFDAVTHEMQWETDGWPGEWVSMIVAGDLERDGVLDLVVGTGRQTAEAEGTFLRVLDAATGELRWRTPSLGTSSAGVVDIAIGAVDADPPREIVASHAGRLLVFDGETGLEELSEPLAGIGPIEILDLTGNSDLDILVGTDDGVLIGLAHDAYHVFIVQPITDGSIDALRVVDLDHDGGRELLLTTLLDGTDESRLRIHDLALACRVWESPPLAGPAGLANGLQVVDVDDDGRTEILVSTGQGLHVFEVELAPGVQLADTLPPVHPGAVGLQAVRPIATPDCCPAVDLEWARAYDGASPPVEHVIHRSTTADFVPGPTTVVGRTREQSWRDVTVAPGTRYHYLVRTEDRLGNVETNQVRRSIETTEALVPDAAELVSIVDRTDCARDGIAITFTHPGIPTDVVFELLVDGIVVAIDVTSPHVHLPGDSDDHVYAIRARHPHCPLETLSTERTIADLGVAVTLPTTTVVDLDECALGEVEIAFTDDGADRHALVVDGLVVADPVTSPVRHAPGDDAPHVYVIRGIDETCGSEVDSSPVVFADVERGLEAPVIVRFDDADLCDLGEGVVTFTHPGFVGAGRYELWRDGAVFLSPFESGAPVPLDDQLVHEYVVRAIDEDCGIVSDSRVSLLVDESGRTPAATLTLIDADACTMGEALVLIDHPGFPVDGRYELWRDSAPWLDPVVDGQTVSLDGVHDYQIYAYDEICRRDSLSSPVLFEDTVGQLPDPVLRVAREVDTDDTLRLSWEPLPAAEVNVYVGSLTTLSAGYDHVSRRPGLRFPDGATVDRGCQ
ncbi:MAG: hypothetical protein AAF533_27275, partial [Acidobacteriota bacterium]